MTLDAEFKRPDGSTDESVKHASDTVPVQVWMDVDRGIAPLVRVLNRFAGVRTLYSCEGHRESEHERRAYVAVQSASQEWVPFSAALRVLLSQHPEISASVEDTGSTYGTLFVDPDQVGQLASALERFTALEASDGG